MAELGDFETLPPALVSVPYGVVRGRSLTGFLMRNLGLIPQGLGEEATHKDPIRVIG